MFKKQFFPEATLRSLATNSTVYDRGVRLFEEGRVESCELDEDNHLAISDVNGNQDDYTTQISFLKNGVARRYHCTCPAFEQYAGACKHVIASMLNLNHIDLSDQDQPAKEDPRAGKKSQLDSYLADLEEDFQKLQINKYSSRSRNRLFFDFILNVSPYYYENAFEIYMKVGIDHMYVIKNVPDLVHTLLNNDDYVFGKNLTYHYKDHFIAPEDRAVLQELADIHANMEQVKASSYQSLTNKNELMIPNQMVGRLLRRLRQVDHASAHFGSSPTSITAIRDLEPIQYSNSLADFPLDFSLTREGSHYYFNMDGIKMNTQPISFFPESRLVVYDHVFYDLSQEDYQVLYSLVKFFHGLHTNEIPMKQDDLSHFMSTIYPTLSRYFDLALDPDIEKTIYQKELTAALYIDYKNKVLSLEPRFNYGQVTVNPIVNQTDQAGEGQVLIRDTVEEASHLDLLYQVLDGLEEEEDHFAISDFQAVSKAIYDGMGQLFESFDLYLTDAVRKLYYQRPNHKPVSIDVDYDANLLQVDFEMEDMASDDIKQILTQLKAGNDRFYKLSSGAILDLERDEFKELKDVADDLSLDPDQDDISNSFNIPLYQGLSLLENNNVDKSDQFMNLAKSLLEPKSISYDVPDQVQADLRPYQKTGYNWLKALDAYQFGGVLADDMGLGKTLQSITFIQSKLNELGGKYLIVCPSSVLYNWQYEFNQFTPEIQPTVIAGTAQEREEVIDQVKDREQGVWISSYPLIQRDSDFYQGIQFETIILDESQAVKNDSAKTTRAVARLQAKNKFALSGTPIENNLNELWTLFSIIQPGMFQDKKSFKQMDQSVIAKKIKPFILRRLKGQVLDDLPEKTETTEYIELSKKQKQIYQTQQAMIQSQVQELLDNNEFERNSVQVLAGMTRLRQICCDPKLVTKQYDGDSAKLDRLMEYLAEAKQNGKRIVLFSQFTKMLDIIRDRLAENDYDYFYLDGQTKKEDRLDLTHRFNKGEKDLFLISLKAGGTGINLTGGDTVILYDSWWNPAIEDQAADRVHRFGQKNHVQVLRLIARGTIEERINELQEKKRDLVDSVIDSKDNQAITSLSKDEILQLLDVSASV